MDNIQEYYFKMIDDLLASKYNNTITDDFINDFESLREKLKNNLPKDAGYFNNCSELDKNFDTYLENKL